VRPWPHLATGGLACRANHAIGIESAKSLNPGHASRGRDLHMDEVWPGVTVRKVTGGGNWLTWVLRCLIDSLGEVIV
jgi:hypothetical protein